MISPVLQDNEESVGPLADGEVARLFSALQSAEFTRSDKHDLAKNSGFKRRSLIEIANDVKKREGASETERQNTKLDVEPNSLRQNDLEDAKTNSLVAEKTVRDITSKQKMAGEATEAEVGVRSLTTNSTSMPETDEEVEGVRSLTTSPTSMSETDGEVEGIRSLTTSPTSMSETDGEAEGIRSLTTKPTSKSENDGEVRGIRGLTSVSHENIGDDEKAQQLGELTSNLGELNEQPTKHSFETANAAFERGKAEGITEGRLAAIAETEEKAIADAKAELADIADTFHKVLDALARPKAKQAEALASSISLAILKLASERAGMQIDEMPQGFHDRIHGLVNSIGQELAKGKIHLNGDDYAAMKPYLNDLEFEAVVNSNLARGDVTIKFDGVELHDVAANRMASHPVEKSINAADDGVGDVNSVSASDAATDDNSASSAENTESNKLIAAADTAAGDENAGLANVLADDEALPPSDESC